MIANILQVFVSRQSYSACMKQRWERGRPALVEGGTPSFPACSLRPAPPERGVKTCREQAWERSSREPHRGCVSAGIDVHQWPVLLHSQKSSADWVRICPSLQLAPFLRGQAQAQSVQADESPRVLLAICTAVVLERCHAFVVEAVGRAAGEHGHRALVEL